MSDENDTPDPFGGHRDVWIEVDGVQHRVLGDPNMSPETQAALAALIRAAKNYVEGQSFEEAFGDDDALLCPTCRNQFGVDGLCRTPGCPENKSG